MSHVTFDQNWASGFSDADRQMKGQLKVLTMTFTIGSLLLFFFFYLWTSAAGQFALLHWASESRESYLILASARNM